MCSVCDGRWEVRPLVCACWFPRLCQALGDRVLPVCRDGKNQYQEVFGVPSNELFTAIYR